MKYEIDTQFLVDCFKAFVNAPSPVGYYVKVNPVVERYAGMFGYTVTYDNKHTAYWNGVPVPGEPVRYGWIHPGYCQACPAWSGAGRFVRV